MNNDDAARPYEPIPLRTGQLSLFAPKFRDACVELGTTVEETDRWQSEGWLSIGTTESLALNDQDLMELRFVAGIARSEYLSVRQVHDFLKLLEKPYAYDPTTTAFSFAEGRWIQVPPDPDPEEVVESHFEEVVSALVDRRDFATLRSWRDLIQDALDTALDEASE